MLILILFFFYLLQENLTLGGAGGRFFVLGIIRRAFSNNISGRFVFELTRLGSAG